MNIVVLLIIINLIFFGAVAYYLSVQRKQLQDQSELEFKRQESDSHILDMEKKELEKELTEVKDEAEFILQESEKLAQELIFELQEALGKKPSEAASLIPDKKHLDEQLGFLKQKIKKQYAEKISHLLKQLQKVQLHEAKRIEEFASEQEAATDVNLQKVRVGELLKMHQRIESYKNQEIALFDEKVKKVVNDAALEVLGHSLSIQDQEELVERAIRKAREENVI